jgi:hypothetical protein
VRDRHRADACCCVNTCADAARHQQLRVHGSRYACTAHRASYYMRADSPCVCRGARTDHVL